MLLLTSCFDQNLPIIGMIAKLHLMKWEIDEMPLRIPQWQMRKTGMFIKRNVPRAKSCSETAHSLHQTSFDVVLVPQLCL